MTTLGDLAASGVLKFSDGYRTKQSEHSEDGFRILRAGDVYGGSIHPLGADFVASEYARAIGEKVSRAGDVVLTTKGTVGRVAHVVEISEPVVYSPQVCFFRTQDSRVLVQRFLGYWLQGPELTEQAGFLMGASDMAPYLSLRDLNRMTITLPSVHDQVAIAEVLGALDDKIAANAVAARDATNLADSLYSRASTSVARVAASSVLTPVLGGTPDRSNANLWIGEVPWVSARDIAGAAEGIVLQTEESISTEAVSRSRAKPVPAGSVIMTARGTVGAVARLGIEAAFNQSCYAFVPVDGLPAACLYFMVKDAATDALSVSHGSVFSTITMRSFDALTVPSFPSEALGRLEAELSPLLALVAARATESRHLAELRDTLLPHLMSGRITVRQAELLVDASGLR